MSTRIAAFSTVLALFLGGCTNNSSEYNLNNKFSDDKSSQSISSVSEESDDSQEELDKKEEENRQSVYGVLFVVNTPLLAVIGLKKCFEGIYNTENPN